MIFKLKETIKSILEHSFESWQKSEGRQKLNHHQDQADSNPLMHCCQLKILQRSIRTHQLTIEICRRHSA
jgi:hypothetical protein